MCPLFTLICHGPEGSDVLAIIILISVITVYISQGNTSINISLERRLISGDFLDMSI